MNSEPPCPLNEFQGRTAEIVQLNLPAADVLRLKSLAVFEGQTIQLQKRGSTIIFTAAGGRVAVAREIAQQIVVQAKTIKPLDVGR